MGKVSTENRRRDARCYNNVITSSSIASDQFLERIIRYR